eukprot:scaffold72920_cov75-Phaeocystis_antarctica.AAC.1
MSSHRPELRGLATCQPSAGLSGMVAGHTVSWQLGRDQTCKAESGMPTTGSTAAAVETSQHGARDWRHGGDTREKESHACVSSTAVSESEGDRTRMHHALISRRFKF